MTLHAAQEFFVWPVVAEAARNALDIRYRLLDYLYTHMHRQSVNGSPVLNPLWFMYPEDSNTFGNQLQFFYGDSILVSPVTEENTTSVSIYLPDDIFYDFYTLETVEGEGAIIELDDIPYTDIPLHVRGGSIIPMRNQSAYTTTEVRKQPFHLLIAPDREGKASGMLYLDDGDSIEQAATSEIELVYDNGELSGTGSFGYTAGGDRIETVTIMGTSSGSEKRDAQGSASLKVDRALSEAFTLSV